MKVDMQWSCISWTCRKPCKAKRDSQQNYTQNHVEYRWCTKWMFATRCNLTSFLPRFSSRKINVHKPKTWGVFLDFRDLFFAPPGVKLQHGLWKWFDTYSSNMSSLELVGKMNFLFHTWNMWSFPGRSYCTTVFFLSVFFLKSLKNCSVFLYFLTGGWFFYSLQKITWTENLNINLNQLNPGTSPKLYTEPSNCWVQHLRFFQGVNLGFGRCFKTPGGLAHDGGEMEAACCKT